MELDQPTPSVHIVGITVHQVDFAQTLALIESWIETARGCPLGAPLATHHPQLARQICTVNPEFIVDAQHDLAFAGVLQRADLCVPDGGGVLWAARLAGVKLAERVTGSDGIYRICERAAQRGWSIFFLGAAPGVAERTATILQQRYPGLRVAGSYSGSPRDADWPQIEQRLAMTQPDMLFVAYGHPRQDFWIDQHRHELPVKVAMGVGGAFDFVTEIAQRAPLWVQRLGLEWLHRLLHEPWRWRRMVKLPVFVALVIKQKVIGY